MGEDLCDYCVTDHKLHSIIGDCLITLFLVFTFVVLEINIMWAAHQAHHSSEDYNLTTALRQSVVQNYTSAVSSLE